MNDITVASNDFMWTGVVLGIIGVLSADRWPIIWIISEINIMSFLPLMRKVWSTKKNTILYFIVQSVSSLLVLAGGLLDGEKCVLRGLLLKIGLFPFHFWGVVLIPTIAKRITFIFLSWQKVGALWLLIVSSPKMFLLLVVAMNVVLSPLFAYRSKRLNILLLFSGIIHLCWSLLSPLFWRYYIYYVVMMCPIFLLKGLNISFRILNLAGLPPFTGFILKLEIMPLLRMDICIVLLSFSLLIVYSYLRIFISHIRGELSMITLLTLLMGIV